MTSKTGTDGLPLSWTPSRRARHLAKRAAVRAEENARAAAYEAMTDAERAAEVVRIMGGF